MLNVYEQSRVSPSDSLFIVKTAPFSGQESDEDENGCVIHLARSAEAAFGRCLAPYRPCRDVHQNLDAFLGTGDELGEVPAAGQLERRFFAGRMLLELRPTRPLLFTPALGRFGRPRHVPRALRSDRVVGHFFRIAHWDYVGLWDPASIEGALALEDASMVDPNDPRLLRAAARLGITLI